MNPNIPKRISLLILFFIGCIAPAFSQPPAITSIQGQAVVCIPNSLPVDYTVATNSSGNFYAWSYSGPQNLILSNASSSVCSVIFPVSTANASYTLTCIASNGSGSSAPVSIIINVFEKPTVTFSGANHFCQGSSTNLSASGTIFQASSTTITYNWSPSTGLSSTNSASVTANPPVTTNYTVLVTNVVCTSTNYFTVNVNPPPVLTASVTPVICKGQNATLILGGSGTSFSVNSIATSFVSTLSPSVTTGYTIIASDVNGCNSLPTHLTLSVNPLPTVTTLNNPAAICKGQSSTLNLSGASTYSLNGIPTGPSGSQSPLTTTNYTITGKDANGCESLPVVQTLTVYALPTINVSLSPTLICTGETSTLGLSGSATTYSLDGNPAAPYASLNPSSTTSYSVSGKDTNSCVNSVLLTLLVDPCTGIKNNSAHVTDLLVFPNPSKGNFILRSSESRKISLYDQLGRLLKTLELFAGTESQLQGLSHGVYFLVTEQGQTVKLVVLE